MKFHYTHTFADYWMLNRRLFVKRIIRAILLYVFLLVLAYLFFLLMGMDREGKWIMAIYLAGTGSIVLAPLLAALFLRAYYTSRKIWNKAAELRCDKTYEFTETGIHITGTEIDGNAGWQHIASAELWRGWIFIATHQNAYIIFPLSAVPDPDALISLLVAKIPKTKGMKPIQN